LQVLPDWRSHAALAVAANGRRSFGIADRADASLLFPGERRNVGTPRRSGNVRPLAMDVRTLRGGPASHDRTTAGEWAGRRLGRPSGEGQHGAGGHPTARSKSMRARILPTAAFGFAAVLYLSATAQAGLTICNRFPRAISVAFAMALHEPGNTAKKIANFFGWYGVASGECRRIRDIDGDNSHDEVTNRLIDVAGGVVKNNQAMYVFIRDDQGQVWDGKTARVSSLGRDEGVGDRRDASGYVWPNTLSICSPTGHGSPDVASVDTLSSDTRCDPGSTRVPYVLINPRYAVEFKLEVK
jgi:hypothetical protein